MNELKISLLFIFFCSSILAEKSQSTVYNQTLALKYWDFVRISQCDISNIISLTCGQVCQKYKNELKYIEVAYQDSNQFLSWQFQIQFICSRLAYSTVDDVIYITFRGSISIENWLHDFEYFQDSYPLSGNYPYPQQNISCKDCKVHGGFYQAYIDIRPTLLEALNSVSQQSNCTKIQVVGHSLGAAMGSHCVLDLLTTNQLSLKYNTLGILTVGCPRVGNKEFASYFDGIVPTAYRVVHYQDIVPHLPLEIMGFYHTEQEVWYTSEQNLDHVFCLSGEDPNCSDSEKVLTPNDHTSYFNEQLTDVTQYCSETNLKRKI